MIFGLHGVASPLIFLIGGSSVTKKSGPCVQLAPILEEISSEMKDVTIAKHNVEEQPNVPVQFSVTGIPHCILFVNGEKKMI